MKILQIIDTLAVGGAEKILVLLANLQKRKGHEVTVLTILEPGALAMQLLPEIPVIALNRKWKFNPIIMYRLVKIAKGYEIIHVHSSHNLRYVFLAFQLFGLKKVLFFHEHFGNIEIDLSVKWHQRLIYPKVQLIGVSRKICQWAVEKVGVPARQVHLLPNTVKDYPFRQNIRNISPDRLYSLILVANIRRPKNIEFALLLIKSLQMCKLTIVGQVVDKLYFDSLLTQIRQFGIYDCVTFVFDCKDIQPLLHQFDLALHTPVSESGPLVLIEYLAQGIPFLSYRTGEIAYQVEKQFPQFIIDNFKSEEWIKRIQLLLSQNRQLLGSAMRQFYEVHFSEDKYFDECLKIYQKGLLS
ncbi:MAG: glycosyltransferase family 4 protein [Thermaurantimonas sp.]|uniref:glycosyltransferase family 4 protein n=1 Tax=Thermaurantimonas sp. TaxID=2681568 RepID=UPI0039192EA7